MKNLHHLLVILLETSFVLTDNMAMQNIFSMDSSVQHLQVYSISTNPTETNMELEVKQITVNNECICHLQPGTMGSFKKTNGEAHRKYKSTS